MGNAEAEAEVAPNVVPSVVGSFQDIPLSTLNAFPVPELRNELKIRGIDPRGLKNLAIRGRLKQALASKVLIHIEPEPNEKEQPKHLRGFPKSAHWEILQHEATPVPEPKNPSGLRAPTVPEAEA